MRTRTPSRKDSQAAFARFIVLTGLSGAGKSQAIRALEDLGYFCVDNLPTMLIPTLAELATRAGSDLEKVAIVVDVREGAFLEEFPRLFRRIRRMRGLKPLLIFLEATDAALVRRFSETRRPHPLAHDRPILDGIREERRRIRPIRALADEIVDTSSLTVHELREAFMSLSRGARQTNRLQVMFLSFGFKHGIPLEADLVFDVRFLPNPHFVPRLRPLTGLDQPVADYIGKFAETGETVARLTDLLTFLVPRYADEGKAYLTVAVGCTGGRHRSVYIAEQLKRSLAGTEGVRLHVRHRDAGRADAPRAGRKGGRT
jgi:RNase adapter protein RapZ